jgi:nucleoside-diphosphate-sugar epimerase
LIQLGRRGQVPIAYIEHCAKAIACAVARPDEAGNCRVINVLDDDLPERGAFVRALQKSGWPRWVLPVSPTIWSTLIALLPETEKLPGLLRSDVFAARLKPLRYSNQQLHEQLGWTSTYGFEDAMARAIGGAVDA